MGLLVIGHGLEGASAASIPKGGNRRSKRAHKTYATPVVVASANALTQRVLNLSQQKRYEYDCEHDLIEGP